MFSKSTFWHKTGAWLQLLTGLIHGISLFSEGQARNDTEKQLLDLMRNYKMDMGAGFHRSFEQIFNSISAYMTFSLLFAAAMNFLLLRAELPEKTRRAVLLANLLYGLAGTVVFYFWAFLPPFMCLLLITLAFVAAYFLPKNNK